jgi:hypothetical protein
MALASQRAARPARDKSQPAHPDHHVSLPARAASASFADAAHVSVALSLGVAQQSAAVIDRMFDAARADTRARAGGLVKYLARHFHAAATTYLEEAFGRELQTVLNGYRLMLRESLARGDDEALKAALNRARLQEKILAGVPMADQAQACVLLGLSGANPSATMKRKEAGGEVLRFTIDGRAAYPLLQFDVEGRRIFPAIARIIAIAPAWSHFRILHWLTRPHLDFDGTPAEALAGAADAVLAAFAREIEPVAHG